MIETIITCTTVLACAGMALFAFLRHIGGKNTQALAELEQRIEKRIAQVDEHINKLDKATVDELTAMKSAFDRITARDAVASYVDTNQQQRRYR